MTLAICALILAVTFGGICIHERWAAKKERPLRDCYDAHAEAILRSGHSRFEADTEDAIEQALNIDSQNIVFEEYVWHPSMGLARRVVVDEHPAIAAERYLREVGA